MANLYETISALCKEKGIKGGKMCTELGFSKSLMTDLKSGRKKGVNAATAQKIADYFGVTVGYLLGIEEEKKPTVSGEQKEIPGKQELTEEDQQLHELLKLIPKEQKKLFLEMGRVFVNNLNKDQS